MRTRDVPLFTGISIGDRVLKVVTLREGIVADTLTANEANKSGTDLELGLRITAQRIKCIDDIQGPMDVDLVRGMTETDYQFLYEALQKFDEECEAEAREALGLAAGGRG